MLSITHTSDIENGLCFSFMDIKPTGLPFFKEYIPPFILTFSSVSVFHDIYFNVY